MITSSGYLVLNPFKLLVAWASLYLLPFRSRSLLFYPTRCVLPDSFSSLVLPEYLCAYKKCILDSEGVTGTKSLYCVKSVGVGVATPEDFTLVSYCKFFLYGLEIGRYHKSRP